MDLTKIAADAGAILNLLEPVLLATVPPAAGALEMATTIAKGVLNEAPAAIDAYTAIKAGALVTPAQLGALYADEQTADAALHAAIVAKEANGGAGSA